MGGSGWRRGFTTLDRAGYWFLCALLCVLPFDPTQAPLFRIGTGGITIVHVLFWVAACLAAPVVIRLVAESVRGDGASSAAGEGACARGRYGDAAGVGILVAMAFSFGISTALSGDMSAGVVWIADLLLAAAIWLAIPRWMASIESVAEGIGRALVAGAVAAAILGFGEFLFGMGLEHRLLWFRPGPVTMGPFLRLSGPFHHPNIAAMYFELALPFAVMGFARELGTRRSRQALVLSLASIDVLLVAVLLTYSRGALLGLLAAGVVAVIAARRTVRLRDLRRYGPWLPAGIAAVVLAAGTFAASTWSIDTVRLSTQNDETWYRVSYSGAPPRVMTAGARADVRVTVFNRSPLPWNSPGGYALSYHWLYPSRRVAQFAAPLTVLRGPVASGDVRTVTARVRAPETPGRYSLIWDLIWHHSTWFGLKTGQYRLLPVTVVGHQRQQGESRPHAKRAEPPIVTLPISRTQTRTDIWQVALDAFRSHPILGGGPHAFRRAYASSSPGGGAGKSPPQSHDLFLEYLADWGIVGTALFLSLIFCLWYPLLRRAWLGRIDSVWQIAVPAAGAAFLAHNLVDYFLGQTSIFVVFWLLCGLAAANRAAQ